MPEQVISGIEGNFSIAGHNFRCAEWTLTVNRDIHDVTGFGTQWRENIGGIKGASGTASGFLLRDAANTAPNLTLGTSTYTGVSFTLTHTAGSLGTCTYTGTGIVNSAVTSTSPNGVGVVSIGFVVTGALTETWDQTG